MASRSKFEDNLLKQALTDDTVSYIRAITICKNVLKMFCKVS